MEFVTIFTQMGWLPIVLLSVGLILFLIEIFVPAYGIFGILGIVSAVAGVIIRIVEGLNFVQSLTLILIVIGAFGVASIFLILSGRFGIIGATGLFENKSTLRKDYTKPDKRLRKLVGKSGKTVGVLNLGGKAKIRGRIYDVMSINSYIESGANIKVVEIKNNQIMVRKWFE